MAFEAKRARALTAMGSGIEQAFHQTKPHLGPLSPGCRLCGQGSWSCLFINGKCNCRCFYCPTSQEEIGVPTTNRIPFPNPADYATFVHRLGFSGVSISGGEPLLTFDRTLGYIKAVRRRMGDDLHVWLYTNGTLLTADRVEALRAVGVNEIRFDISAAAYDLKKVALAVGRIPCVTIEIPAIPEDLDKLAALLPEMRAMGVNYLNLHQLRLTPHNRARLMTRDYTYLHGEKATVLESEWTALALMQQALEKGVGLPVNYCSFVYKHRCQRAAARKKNAPFVLNGHESVTKSGFIRTLAAWGGPEEISRQADQLSKQGVEIRLWQMTGKKDRLRFHPSLWPVIDRKTVQLQVGYAEAVLCPHMSYRNPFKEIRLSPNSKIYVERQPHCPDVTITAEQCAAFENVILQKAPDGEVSADPLPDDILGHEFIEPGLQNYF
ncbi:MAG: radical SAM protein [Desulfobacterales bacterium]|nr:radical SAM protein [Desulfobacterales bacterium]